MVREALFSILGNAVPDRPFFDIFAGTGINGLEALSRGASAAVFVERDFRLANEIEQHLRAFKMAPKARVIRTDAYRWAETWQAPAEPVNLFLSPPFADFQRRLDALLLLVSDLQRKCAPASVLVLQSEKHSALDKLPHQGQWDRRRYGRNELLIWVKDTVATAAGAAGEGPAATAEEPTEP
jgi:16S rRNA (guanine(966)-N(2))-methyltransferase RsmD